MKWRNLVSLALFAACAATAWAANYTWTAHGADDDWDTCGNWAVIGGGCYPDDSSDDATIPYHAGGWTINLVTVNAMDDLTIDSSVTFGAAVAAPTLYADSLTIGATNAESVLTISSASIVVN